MKTLLHKTSDRIIVSIAAVFILTAPLFYLITRYFYAEDMIDIIESIERGEGLPPSFDLEKDIIAGVMIQYLLIFVVIALSLLIAIRLSMRNMWHPFENTLKSMEKFKNGILLTTKENLRTSHNAGIELVWNMRVTDWLDINLNGTGYYNRINASRLGFGGNREMFSWSGLLNADFTPIKHGTVQLNARYQSATLVPQGKRDGDFQLNLGLKYDIPSINLALFASVTDLLDTYKLSYTLDTPALKQKVEKRRNPRIIYVGLSWNFGGAGKKQHHNVEYDEEM